MEKKHIIWAVVAVVVIGGGIYLYKRNKASATPATPTK